MSKPKLSSAKKAAERTHRNPRNTAKQNPEADTPKRQRVDGGFKVAGVKKLFRLNPALGRPPTLTQRLIDHAERLLQSCVYVDTISASLGVTRHTWRNWMKAGREEYEHREAGNSPQKSQEIYLRFYCMVFASKARAEIMAIDVIRLAGLRDAKLWNALAWWLSKQRPERYGDNAFQMRQMQKDLNEVLKRLEHHEKTNNGGSNHEE